MVVQSVLFERDGHNTEHTTRKQARALSPQCHESSCELENSGWQEVKDVRVLEIKGARLCEVSGHACLPVLDLECRYAAVECSAFEGD